MLRQGFSEDHSPHKLRVRTRTQFCNLAISYHYYIPTIKEEHDHKSKIRCAMKIARILQIIHSCRCSVHQIFPIKYTTLHGDSKPTRLGNKDLTELKFSFKKYFAILFNTLT